MADDLTLHERLFRLHNDPEVRLEEADLEVIERSHGHYVLTKVLLREIRLLFAERDRCWCDRKELEVP